MSDLVPTVAATPATAVSAASLLAQMAALNGQATDYNQGSQIRTYAEATGGALEQQGISAQALALQALLYGALSLFGVSEQVAYPASGLVVYATSFPLSAAPPVPQAVLIPSGTIVGTAGGIQFINTNALTIASGTSYTSGFAVATVAGASGNIPASGITGGPLTAVGWPLVVTNPTAMSGGVDAGNQSISLAQLTAIISRLGLSSPVAVANAPIGITVSGTGETVKYASAFEPWLAAALMGSGTPGSGTAGYLVYVDNGTGFASQDLINVTIAWLNGNQTLNESGFRPIGVPFTVSGVTPVYAMVSVSGTLIPGTLQSGSVQAAVTSGIVAYFNNLGFSPDTAQQPQIAGAAADPGLGAWSSLIVNLAYSGASGSVAVVSGGVGTRVILAGLSVSVSGGA